MRSPGQVIILRFPQTDFSAGKLRPAVLVAPSPGFYEDWLTCMISTKLHQALSGFDEVISHDNDDFILSGLKMPSVIRVARLAVVSTEVLMGSLGKISPARLERVQKNISSWITGNFSELK